MGAIVHLESVEASLRARTDGLTLGPVDVGFEVEGWYKDPWGLHEERWFSDGTPTKLVRDGGQTSHDDPPSEPYAGQLEEPDEVAVANETLRADDQAPAQDMMKASQNFYGIP